MEVLNLLKFWKTSPSHDEENSTTTTHIDLSIDGSSDNEVDEEDDSFFELKITAPDYYNVKNRDTQQENNIKNHKNGDNVEDFKHQAKTGFAQNDIIFAESNLSRFKCRRILPIEPTSKPQSPISILKSAPKFRIFMMGSKTRKTEKTEGNRAASVETPKHSQQGSKKFTLKINLEEDEEEEAHSLSMFTRVNSSRTTGSKLQKQSTNESSPIDSSKRFSKDVVQKYLKLIKPFYVKVSKRYSDRVKLSDLMYTDSPASSPSPAAAAVVSPKNVPAGFRVLSKHLGKSRSASAAVGVVSPAVASRRDDSLLQQDDGIQSAIQHCKRSFNSSRGESCLLSRCTSDTTHEKLTEPWRKSTEEEAVDGC